MRPIEQAWRLLKTKDYGDANDPQSAWQDERPTLSDEQAAQYAAEQEEDKNKLLESLGQAIEAALNCDDLEPDYYRTLMALQEKLQQEMGIEDDF
tara:strand:+ start:283 stop:567 length:285 start_codon:yes stop_codon:yes gene_type:complete